MADRQKAIPAEPRPGEASRQRAALSLKAAARGYQIGEQTFYGLEAGVDEVSRRIRASMEAAPVIVLIGGGSGSGRTTVGLRIRAALHDAVLQHAVLISLNYYRKNSGYRNNPKGDSRFPDPEHPECFDFELAKAHLVSLRDGKAVERPGERGRRHRKIYPARVIVMEGSFALRDELVGLADQGLRIFVEATKEVREERRVLRDAAEGMPSEKTRRYFDDFVEPAYQRHVLETRHEARTVILNEEQIPELVPLVARS